MLINDATFLLDESLDTLKAIHDTQVAMRDATSWNAQPQVHWFNCIILKKILTAISKSYQFPY